MGDEDIPVAPNRPAGLRQRALSFRLTPRGSLGAPFSLVLAALLTEEQAEEHQSCPIPRLAPPTPRARAPDTGPGSDSPRRVSACLASAELRPPGSCKLLHHLTAKRGHAPLPSSCAAGI